MIWSRSAFSVGVQAWSRRTAASSASVHRPAMNREMERYFGATKPAAIARLWYSVFFWSSLYTVLKLVPFVDRAIFPCQSARRYAPSNQDESLQSVSLFQVFSQYVACSMPAIVVHVTASSDWKLVLVSPEATNLPSR